MTTNGARLDLYQLAAKNGYPDPSTNEAHTCIHCGAPVACEWKTILETRRAARDMLLQSVRAEAKLLGVPFGRRARAMVTVEEAREAVQRLGNIARAAKALGVNWETVKRRVSGDAGIGGR